jgi:hypothetical protein
MMGRRIVLGGAAAVISSVFGLVAWAAVNPPVRPIWTYLGPTYGADWVMPPQISFGYIPGNAVLATTITAYQQVYRGGFYTPGDGGGGFYTHSSSPCSLNAGVGDNGSQVKAIDGGCWIADLSSSSPTPLVWGAKGDGTTDDTVPVQAAITAMAGKTLFLGPHKYCIGAPGLVAYKAISIEGDTPGWPWDMSHPNWGFTACAPNINMLTFGTNGPDVASGSRLSGVFFDAGAAGVNTSGAGITANQTSFLTIDHVVVYRACIGIDERMSNTDRIEHIMIHGDGTQLAAGCGGIRVGAASTGAQLTDLRLQAVTSDVHGDWGLWVQDAGGLQISHADFLSATNGLLVKPGINQSVTWLFADDSALGDTTCASAVLIDTGAASASVRGLVFNGTWSSSAGSTATGCLGSGVQIQNTGGTGAIVRGIHFLGHRAYNNGREGFLLEAGLLDVTIDASMICGNSVQTSVVPANHYAGIAVSVNVAGVAIRNNRISPSCAYTPYINLQTSGIYLYGSNYGLTIVGNDLHDSTVGLAGTPPTEFSVIKDNNGVDDQVDSIAAASPLPLGLSPVAAMTGATTIISSITGMWFGREVYLLARDATQNLAAPGSGDATHICNNRTVLQGQMVKAVSVPGANCIYIFPP